MLNIGKRLAIFAYALLVLGAFTFFLLNAPAAQAVTPPAPAPAKAAAPAPAKAATSAPATTTATGNLLAAPKSLQIDVAAAMKDRVLGNPNAPVTITEYASLTCPHCAHFDMEILPDVKNKLIDTGKAKLIFRDFPLDGEALKAAMMARCVSPLKYFDMLDVLFTNQQRWIGAKDPMAALAQLGSLAGMDATQFKACTENKDLETAIITNMKKAQDKYKIDATPTFIFNDGAAKLRGAWPVTKFEETVAGLTPKGK